MKNKQSNIKEIELIRLCVNGNLDEIKLLLKNNPDININFKENENTCNPLTCAAINGHFDVVKYLLFSKDLKVNANLNADNDLAFILTIDQKHKKIIDFFIYDCNIQRSPDINAKISEYPEVEDKFNKRDLFLSMKNNLLNNNKMKKMKI